MEGPSAAVARHAITEAKRSKWVAEADVEFQSQAIQLTLRTSPTKAAEHLSVKWKNSYTTGDNSVICLINESDVIVMRVFEVSDVCAYTK